MRLDTFLFDDVDSLVHGGFGFVLNLCIYIGVWCRVLGFLSFLGFIIYEVREPENAVSTLGDVLEFLVGFVGGLILFTKGF